MNDQPAAPEREKESGEQKFSRDDELRSIAERLADTALSYPCLLSLLRSLEADHLSALSTLQERVKELTLTVETIKYKKAACGHLERYVYDRDEDGGDCAMCDLTALQERVEKLEKELATSQRSAESWKGHFEMYRNAWVRELGGWLFPKSHEIDALVLTTRARCVNPILGQCERAHWLGKPTADGKALQQDAHPIDVDCRGWKAVEALAEMEKEQK